MTAMALAPQSKTGSSEYSQRATSLPPNTSQREPSVELPVSRSQWMNFMELLGNFAAAVCLCMPFAPSGKIAEVDDMPTHRGREATKGSTKCYSVVRPPTDTEVFIVRAIVEAQEPKADGFLSRISSFNYLNFNDSSWKTPVGQVPPTDSISQLFSLTPKTMLYDGSDAISLDRHGSKELERRSRSLRPSDSLERSSRSQSVPFWAERRWGIESKSSEETMCRICCTEPADVVLLPCRHGGICYMCFRRILFMKPIHRGGSSCPICRRHIREAVRINAHELHKHSAALHYGVGIDMPKVC